VSHITGGNKDQEDLRKEYCEKGWTYGGRSDMKMEGTA
jgi:hypothetical protein